MAFLENVFCQFDLQVVEWEMAPTLFMTYLKDRAVTWYKSLTKETKDDFSKIIQEFEKVFITEGRTKRINKWLNLRQEDGEKVSEFI